MLIHFQCSWMVDGEEDRPASKQFVEALRAKAQLLEAEITQLKLEQRHTPAGTSSSGAQPEAEFSSGAPQPSVPSGSVSHVNTNPSAPGFRTENVSHFSLYQAPPTHNATQSHLVNAPPLLTHIHIQPTDQRPTPSSEPMATSAEKQPSLAYQYIFNINTSLPLDEQSPEHRASLQCQWDRYLPELDVQLSRHEHDTLLSRCFNYGAAWHFGLFPDLFLRDMLEILSPDSTRTPGELQHYSPLLHCSMLAFASPLSDNPVIQQISTREKFVLYAKRQLDEEFAYANPSLILSLILLAEYHLGIGERNTGYMYTGMSMRAVRAGTGSPLRDWYRWSAFVQEKFLAHEMNRPSEMPVPKVPIGLPIALEFDDQPLSVHSIGDLFAHEHYNGITLECFIQCAKLMLIPTAVYATSPSSPWNLTKKKIPLNSRSGSTTAENIQLQLDTWSNALPNNLLIRESHTLTPPPVLTLHIRYWWSILQLKSLGSKNELSHATEKLVELFEAFDIQFGFQFFPRNLAKVSVLHPYYLRPADMIVDRQYIRAGAH
ncbi:unnamed protein product [Rhizoctonia solani]|uniref:Xylanolytic transcriptional activator regulatory domain-containing protein n=1 Tax=Rhizoctonia solani TaxID=456999 RepID=A0A8H3HS41_9AGAM|nr:unnamed protein product [Rhizoctonia solani]